MISHSISMTDGLTDVKLEIMITWVEFCTYTSIIWKRMLSRITHAWKSLLSKFKVQNEIYMSFWVKCNIGKLEKLLLDKSGLCFVPILFAFLNISIIYRIKIFNLLSIIFNTAWFSLSKHFAKSLKDGIPTLCKVL